MNNLYNDIIFKNLFEKYLNEELPENEATKSKEFENLSK